MTTNGGGEIEEEEAATVAEGTSSSDKGSHWRTLLGKRALVLKLLTLLIKGAPPRLPTEGLPSRAHSAECDRKM